MPLTEAIAADGLALTGGSALVGGTADCIRVVKTITHHNIMISSHLINIIFCFILLSNIYGHEKCMHVFIFSFLFSLNKIGPIFKKLKILGCGYKLNL